MNQIASNIKLWGFASLTLGLAPFVPEPHIVGKIRWIMGGAHGMQTIDWFDTLLHGTPWVLFIFSIVLNLIKLLRK